MFHLQEGNLHIFYVLNTINTHILHVLSSDALHEFAFQKVNQYNNNN